MRTIKKTEVAESIETPAAPSENVKITPERPLIPQVSYTQILVLALIIASYLLGLQTEKVQSLSNGTALAAQPGTIPQVTQPPQKQNVTNGSYPIKGNSNAKVTIVEFADLRCPFCEQFYKDTEPQIIKDYVDSGKAKFAFRNYAFLGPASTVAANAAACANEQGKFWDFHDYLYKNQPSETDTSMYTTDNMTKVAGDIGMDTTEFNSCLSANKYTKIVDGDMSDGQKAGVSGTPTVFIDGIPVVGAQPYASFKTIIDQELAKK